jgi:hypothetical protein
VQILDSGQSRALACIHHPCTAGSANRVWGGPISDRVNGNGVSDGDGSGSGSECKEGLAFIKVCLAVLRVVSHRIASCAGVCLSLSLSQIDLSLSGLLATFPLIANY